MKPEIDLYVAEARRKASVRLLPFLSILYLISFIDAAAKPFSWHYSDVNRLIYTKELNATAH